MKILGIVGSMRKNRMTDQLVSQVLSEICNLSPTIETEIIHIAEKDCHPCRVTCSNFCSSHPHQCSLKDDVMNILQQMISADALVIGAPLYFRGPPAKFQAFIERLISMFFFHQSSSTQQEISPLYGKPCGLIATAEYSNPHQILEYLHDFCTVLNMKPLQLDHFPYLGAAGQGDIEQDNVFAPLERAKELAECLMTDIK